MLIEMYIFFEIILIGFFLLAFFTKQEIIWALTAVFAGFQMFASFSIETYNYIYDTVTGAYVPTITSASFLYLSWINMIFFVLALILGLFDLFDKYGTKFIKKNKEEKDDGNR